MYVYIHITRVIPLSLYQLELCLVVERWVRDKYDVYIYIYDMYITYINKSFKPSNQQFQDEIVKMRVSR